MAGTTRREVLIATGIAAGTLLAGQACAATIGEPVFTPEAFGAKGDGVSDDTDALAALATAVTRNGGGTVEFRRVTYKVGRQLTGRAGEKYSFSPAHILEFRGCRRPLVLRGNGARLQCASGLRYGVFSPDGRPERPAMPYLGNGLATPYRHMILVEGCMGDVDVSGFDLDGGLRGLRIGGQYGDTGWQIPAIGLALIDNRGSETVRDVYTHHHAQDGLYIDGHDAAVAPGTRRLISSVRSEYNGRQGCSIVGGRGYVFSACRFAHTGKAGLSSAPGAGVDIEAEGGKRNRDFRFTDCHFSNNSGPGMVADSGDSEGASFSRCTFVGTTAWSAWPNKPLFRFSNCTFAGAFTRAYGDPNPERAAHFLGCRFSDDPALSPTKALYGGTNGDRPLGDLADAKNVLFSRCAFVARHAFVMPWSSAVIYQDCTMEQASPIASFPRGEYRGRNVIRGAVDINFSRIPGEVDVNGRRLAATRL